MLIPRDTSAALRNGHIFARMLESPLLDVVTDAESPSHCTCRGTTLPLRRGGHCECIQIHSKRAPPGLSHDVVTDAESPAHCVCPGSKVPARSDDGHCNCVEPHSKRENDPTPNSSGAPSKAATTASKSTVTAAKLSVTRPSSFITTSKSSITKQNSSETSVLDTVTAKSTLTKASASTVTATVVATKPLKGLILDEPEVIEVKLPPLTRPVLVCFLGACFGSNELSSVTNSLSKRDLRHLGALPPSLTGSCDEDNISVCLGDHRSCYCHIAKRSMPKESIAHHCPPDQLLVCHGSYSSCSCNDLPRDEKHLKPVLSPVPASCSTGGLVCYQSLCYCPLFMSKSDSTSIRPEGLGP